MAFIEASALFKIYKVADLEVVALQGLDLEIEQGELVAIVGASGSGKSTLLNVLGGLDLPSAGRITVGGNDLLRMTEGQLVRYRREEVGFIWQQPGKNLLPYLTALQNVELPMVIAGRSGREQKQRARQLLESVGLADREDQKPDQLSGGEQQRVATAVALSLNPPLLLADEPTGELDVDSAAMMIALFRTLCSEQGVTIVLVTHDLEVSAAVDRVALIRDGRVSTETLRAGTTRDEELVVVDGSGRLQIPKLLMEEVGIQGRAKIARFGDHIAIWPWQSGQ